MCIDANNLTQSIISQTYIRAELILPNTGTCFIELTSFAIKQVIRNNEAILLKNYAQDIEKGTSRLAASLKSEDVLS